MTIQLRQCWAFALMAAVVATLSSPTAAQVQTPQAFPLYCHGGGHMKTEILTTGSIAEVDTTFTWDDQGAGAQPPKRGECAWADRGPRPGEFKAGNTNFICDSRTAGFHGIFGAGRASENSGENLPLKMAPIVVEVRGGEVGYIPGIVSDGDKFFGFIVYRDEAKANCLHVTRYLGEVRPPFSAKP